MEVISIDGIQYTKASKIAKQFKYTADYVGQLCRGRKIDAKLVGRTWYVSEKSLTNHKSTKNTKSVPAEINLESKVESATSEAIVEPVLRGPTIKVMQEKLPTTNFARRIDWKPVRYEDDTRELLPTLSDNTQAKRVQVDLAESSNLKVAASDIEEVTSLEAEALPEVSLAGKIKIHSIDDLFDKPTENIDISEVLIDKPDEIERVNFKPKKFRQSNEGVTYGISEDEATYAVDINSRPSFAQKVSFAPSHVASNPALQKNANSSQSSEVASEPILKLGRWIVLLVAILSFLSVSLIEFSIKSTSVESTISYFLSVPKITF